MVMHFCFSVCLSVCLSICLFICLLVRFETGCSILRILFAKAKHFSCSLPLDSLWPNLVAVACQHSGKQRLQVVQLLLELLHLQQLPNSPSVASPTAPSRQFDLSALKPLWQLYTSMAKEYGQCQGLFWWYKSNMMWGFFANSFSSCR